MSSIIAALLSGQAFADQDISGNLFGDTVIDSGAKVIVQSGAVADLGSTGVIYNYGTLQIDGMLDGQPGSKIISGVGSLKLITNSTEVNAAKEANPFAEEKTCMELGDGGKTIGGGTISSDIARESWNVVPAGALDETEFEIGGNEAPPQLDVIFQNTTLTISADNAKLEGNMEFRGGKLVVPFSKRLTIPNGFSLVIGPASDSVW